MRASSSLPLQRNGKGPHRLDYNNTWASRIKLIPFAVCQPVELTAEPIATREWLQVGHMQTALNLRSHVQNRNHPFELPTRYHSLPSTTFNRRTISGYQQSCSLNFDLKFSVSDGPRVLSSKMAIKIYMINSNEQMLSHLQEL